jgi:hypothetical protein
MRSPRCPPSIGSFAHLPKNADWEAHGKRQRGFDRGKRMTPGGGFPAPPPPRIASRGPPGRVANKIRVAVALGQAAPVAPPSPHRAPRSNVRPGSVCGLPLRLWVACSGLRRGHWCAFRGRAPAAGERSFRQLRQLRRLRRRSAGPGERLLSRRVSLYGPRDPEPVEGGRRQGAPQGEAGAAEPPPWLTGRCRRGRAVILMPGPPRRRRGLTQ